MSPKLQGSSGLVVKQGAHLQKSTVCPDSKTLEMSPAATLRPTLTFVGLGPPEENVISLSPLVMEGRLQKAVLPDVAASVFDPTPILPVQVVTTDGELHTPAFDMDFGPPFTKGVSDNDCNFTLDSIFEPVEPISGIEDYCDHFSPGSDMGLPEREDSFSIVNSTTEVEFICSNSSAVCVPYVEVETVQEESRVTIDTKPVLKVDLSPDITSSFVWNDLITINTPDLLDISCDVPLDLMSCMSKNVDEINFGSPGHVKSVTKPVHTPLANTKETKIDLSQSTRTELSSLTSSGSRKRKAELAPDDLPKNCRRFLDEDDDSHYRHMRDTNNEASKRSRQNRKNWETTMARTAEAMEQRHIMLVSQVEKLQRLVYALRKALLMAVTQK